MIVPWSDRTGFAIGTKIRGGDLAARLVLFCISWLSTYSKAVVNGDDINHFRGPYGLPLFLPKFEAGWIPNRVLDMYGRNLLAHMFDLVFFPAHALFGADFFSTFKVFNATLFAAFLCWVHHGLLLRMKPGGDQANSTLVSLLVAFSVLLIFPWTNEVRFVCYQLPGFISFLVLADFFTILSPDSAGHSAPWILTTGFVAAFSLEADAAIILVTLAFCWFVARPWPRFGFWRHDATILAVAVCLFCVAALIATVTLSGRAEVTASFQPAREFAQLLLHGGPSPSPNSWKYAELLLAGCTGLATIYLFRPYFLRLSGLAVDKHPASSAFRLCRPTSLFFLVLSVTLVVVALTSFETDHDYFDYRTYPWGDLLLIPELFLVLAIAVPAGAEYRQLFAIDAARLLAVAVALSWMATAATGSTAKGYTASTKVLAAYHAALFGSVAVFDTGLSLDTIEMGRRPLPTATSPDWFAAGYQAMFLKYYGIHTNTIFK